MLVRVDDLFEKLDPLLVSLRRDPASFEGWHALYFSVPSLPDQEMELQITHAADILGAYLNMAEGFMCRSSRSSLLVVCSNVSDKHVVEAGMQASEVVLSQADVIPTYEVYTLARDVDLFTQMVMTRFGLDHVSPPPSWSSPSHILRICRDGDAHHQVLRETLARSSRVLLVEDDPVTRWLVRNALKDECELMTASTAGKAIQMYKEHTPDLVLLDIGLPDCDGTTVLDDIIAHDPAAKVVMFTHSDDFDTLTGTMARGASGFITKPFHRARLLDYIR